MGLFVNLVLAAALYWVIVGIGRVTQVPISTPILGWVLLALVIALSVGGVWKAFSPVVREIRVTLPGAPEEWKGRRIVQLSDVHLGSIYRAGFLSGVVERVNGLKPDLVVITGDLFDGVDGDLAGVALPLRELKTSKGVYFVTGNHETYLGVDHSLAALAGTGVRVLRDEVMGIDGVKLIGFDYPARGEEKDIIATLERLWPEYAGYPTILLTHAPKRIPDVATHGVHLQLSGHTHKGQQFPFGFVTRLVHKGFDYGLYTIGDFQLYTSSGVGTWGPPLRIGTRSEIVLITVE
jgi:predicted MPP superfamily phosphohydrolase